MGCHWVASKCEVVHTIATRNKRLNEGRDTVWTTRLDVARCFGTDMRTLDASLDAQFVDVLQLLVGHGWIQVILHCFLFLSVPCYVYIDVSMGLKLADRHSRSRRCRQQDAAAASKAS